MQRRASSVHVLSRHCATAALMQPVAVSALSHSHITCSRLSVSAACCYTVIPDQLLLLLLLLLLLHSHNVFKLCRMQVV
jgi:hypothetical protein